MYRTEKCKNAIYTIGNYCFFVSLFTHYAKIFFKIFVKKFFYVKSMSYLCTVINQK
jgi:hypothetical protein